MRRSLLGVLASSVLASPAQGAAVFVQGEVPDWDQPYHYSSGMAPCGPGPNPAGPPAPTDPFDAWCGPTSTANLLGHWEDARGVAVADSIPFNLSSTCPPQAPLPWPGGPTWHDYSAEDLATRPAAGSPNPATVADLGFYMDTNHLGTSARGNGAPHTGTLAKDVHAGLQDLLDSISYGWITGTRGSALALGTDADGAAATTHPDEVSAFEHIVREIDANRTVIVNWSHWALTGSLGALSPVPSSTEAQFGGTYYDFASPGTDPHGNDEDWDSGIGHIVTAVGYIRAGDPDDINAPGNPTNWMIVHDNVVGTPRNVIVPLGPAEFASDWVANTTANQLSPVKFPLNPKDTYLRTNLDSAGDAVAIHLPALGISPGEVIRLRRVGDWAGTTLGPDTETKLVAVFSNSPSLLAQNLQNRVAGAIDVGPDFATLPTHWGTLPTDILEDFFVDKLTLRVPPMGFYLFVAAPDNLYGDNSDPDGDFCIEISSADTPVPTLTPWGVAALGLVLAVAAAHRWRRAA